MKMTARHISAAPQNDQPELRPSCSPMPCDTTLASAG